MKGKDEENVKEKEKRKEKKKETDQEIIGLNQEMIVIQLKMKKMIMKGDELKGN